MARDIDVRPEAEPDDHPVEDQSVGQIVGRVTSDLSQLFRQEVALAKTELKEEISQAGKGAGMISGAGIAALFVLQLCSLAAAWVLADHVARGAAFLIVAGVWAIVGLVLFTAGRRHLAAAKPFPPQKTVETLKEDVQWAKDQMK
ncbi:MAG TPA: phage holin family protein [Acidimicrobiia bacterium]|nr:phage holin family protein [Acidimicrobiia bacterium]